MRAVLTTTALTAAAVLVQAQAASAAVFWK